MKKTVLGIVVLVIGIVVWNQNLHAGFFDFIKKLSPSPAQKAAVKELPKGFWEIKRDTGGFDVTIHPTVIQPSFASVCDIVCWKDRNGPIGAFGKTIGEAVIKAAQLGGMVGNSMESGCLHRGDINSCLMAAGFNPVLGLCEGGEVETYPPRLPLNVDQRLNTQVNPNAVIGSRGTQAPKPAPGTAIKTDAISQKSSSARTTVGNIRTDTNTDIASTELSQIPITAVYVCARDHIDMTSGMCGTPAPTDTTVAGMAGNRAFGGGGTPGSTPANSVIDRSGRASQGGNESGPLQEGHTRYTTYDYHRDADGNIDGTMITSMDWNPSTGQYSITDTMYDESGSTTTIAAAGNLGEDRHTTMADELAVFRMQDEAARRQQADREIESGRPHGRVERNCGDKPCPQAGGEVGRPVDDFGGESGSFSFRINTPRGTNDPFNRYQTTPVTPHFGGTCSDPVELGCSTGGTPSMPNTPFANGMVMNPLIGLVNPVDDTLAGSRSIGVGAGNPCNGAMTEVPAGFYVTDCLQGRAGISGDCNSPAGYLRALQSYEDYVSRGNEFRGGETESPMLPGGTERR